MDQMNERALERGDNSQVFEYRMIGNLLHVRTRMQNGNQYFICVGSLEDLNCRGRAIVYQNGGERISVAHRREHQANPLEQQIYDLKWAFFRAVTRTFTEPLNAYARLQVQYPQAAEAVPFISLNASVRRWRRQSGPPTPETLEEFAILLTTEEWRNAINYNAGAMTASFVGDGNERSVVIHDPRLLRSMDTTRTLVLDLSYGVHPRIEWMMPNLENARHLMLILIVHNDVVFVGFVVVMQARTRNALQSVFQETKRVMARLRPVDILCENEEELRFAVHVSFPHSIARSSYFHTTQV